MAELREGGNGVLPQVELTQRQTPGQGSQRRDAVGAGKEAGARFSIVSVVRLKKVCVCVCVVRKNSTFTTKTNLSASTSILTIWEKMEI